MAQHVIHLVPSARPMAQARYNSAEFPRFGPVSAMLYRVVLVIAQWETRRKTRLELKDLDAYLLKDIGMTPDMARIEARKPFYRP